MSYLIAPVHEKMAENLPSIKKSDEGKVLVVKDGKWVTQKAQGGSAPLPELAKVATSGSYKDLKNKPDLSVYIKEADLAAAKEEILAEMPVIPENVGAFINDVGYITGVAWKDVEDAPENLSDFQNDAGFISADEIPEIPDKVSAFENDAEYIARDQYDKLAKALDNLIVAAGNKARSADGEIFESAMDGINAAEPNVPMEVIMAADEPEGDAFVLKTADGDVDKIITFDLNGHEYAAAKADGSVGTQTQAIHLEKGNTVVIKGGTLSALASNPNLKMMIQNYSNLVLEDMVIDCSDNSAISYIVSNNFGSCTIKNCYIAAHPSCVAVDCWFGLNGQGLYDDGVHVIIEDSHIKGDIEYGVQAAAMTRPGNESWWEKAVIEINNSIIEGQIKNSGADTDPTHCTIYVDGVKQESLPVVFNGEPQ